MSKFKEMFKNSGMIDTSSLDIVTQNKIITDIIKNHDDKNVISNLLWDCLSVLVGINSENKDILIEQLEKLFGVHDDSQ